MDSVGRNRVRSENRDRDERINAKNSTQKPMVPYDMWSYECLPVANDKYHKNIWK